ncbi:MAG: hypothetical protein EA380_06875 [Phycisphaeraceae bacterium]|nr:MAG: hypothetical protein EA380_06875 [Phycisphaeraceae bacterium]
MIAMRHLRLLPCILLCILCACTNGTQSGRNASAPDRPGPARETIATGGDAVLLGSLSGQGLTAQQLATRLASLLREQRYFSALTLIAQHPETARLLILRSDRQALASPAIRFAAAALDHLTQTGSDEPWLTTILWRLADIPASHRYETEQARLQSLIQSGQFAEAVRIDLPALLPLDAPAPLCSEAVRLRALALLMTAQNDGAADLLSGAFESARARDPLTAPTLGLLASEAAQRAGRLSRAQQLWLAAVEAATHSASLGMVEPGLWQRLWDVQPEETEWPADAVRLFADVSSIQDRPEATHPAAVGTWLMQQDAHARALVILKQAETSARSAPARELLRLRQARCLIAMDQAAAATAILTQLSTSERPGISGQARAVLALQQLQLGRGEEAMALMTSAMTLLADTPHAPSIKADLGLICLTVGQSDRGLALLEQAKEDFSNSGAWSDWLRVQQNLAIWHEENADLPALEATRRAIAQFERGTPVRIPPLAPIQPEG